MACKVVMTLRAREQLMAFVRYLTDELKNEQAALSLLDDAADTQESLSYVAQAVPLCADLDLRSRNIRKIRLIRHRYLWLYRVENNTAYILAMYHELQDYENVFQEEGPELY